MLALFLIYVLKGKRGDGFAFAKKRLLRKLAQKVKYLIMFFIVLLLVSSASVSDDDIKIEKISFKIIKRNSSIGFINIEKSSFKENTTYTINSEVNARIIFNFKATGVEKSVFKDDTLIFSSMYREINGKEKLNHSISLINGKYILKDKNRGEREVFNLEAIHRNLATLLFFEPINIQKIYSDKFKRKVKINHIGYSTYKVKLPNNSVSVYHYKDGKCVLIDIQGMFYKVKLIRTI